MTNPIHWAATARPGDIAMFRFPLSESDAVAKARPCLIISRQDGGFGPRLTLAYGTTAPTDANRGHELSIANPAAAAQAGLHRPTRFVLARRMTVSVEDQRFDLGREHSPLIGTLPASLHGPMQTLLGRLSGALTTDSRSGHPPCESPLTRSLSISRRTRSGRSIEMVVVETRRRPVCGLRRLPRSRAQGTRANSLPPTSQRAGIAGTADNDTKAKLATKCFK